MYTFFINKGESLPLKSVKGYSEVNYKTSHEHIAPENSLSWQSHQRLVWLHGGTRIIQEVKREGKG